MLIVQMIPGIVMANALYTMFSKLGLIDSYLGLILADCTATIPFAILVLRAFMVAHPEGTVRGGHGGRRGLLADVHRRSSFRSAATRW